MTYSRLDQETLDLDLFFKDSEKFIHIASGGGHIPAHLAAHDKLHRHIGRALSKAAHHPVYEVKVNPQLALSIDGTALDDFIWMAGQGFFSYDKTNPGQHADPFFHLVAWPVEAPGSINIDTDHILKVAITLPRTFGPFDLMELFKHSS